MNPISSDIIPDGKWRFDMRPMIGVRTRDDVGEVYIMDRSIPNMIRDVERVTIGKQVYLPERTCRMEMLPPKETRMRWLCSECSGVHIGEVGHFLRPNFCHNCGAKVVSE